MFIGPVKVNGHTWARGGGVAGDYHFFTKKLVQKGCFYKFDGYYLIFLFLAPFGGRFFQEDTKSWTGGVIVTGPGPGGLVLGP